MKKKNVERTIRKYVRDNYARHPQAFPDTLAEVTRVAKTLGSSYWDHRTNKEIRRDEHTNVTEDDYEAWCISELTDLKKMALFN